MSTAKRLWRRGAPICLLVSTCISLTGIQPALAQGTSYGAQGVGSITLDMYDDISGARVDPGSFVQGQRIRLVPKAFGPRGETLTCTPTFAPIQGVTNNQIQSIENGVMIMGAGFGSAEVSVQCRELPGVQHKTYITNKGRPLGQPQEAKGMGAGGAILTGLAIGGAVALAAVAASAAGGGGGSDSSKTCLKWNCNGVGGCITNYGGVNSGSISYASPAACQAAKPNDLVSSCSAC